MPALIILVLLAVWEFCVHAFAMPLYVLPAPSQVVLALIGEADTLLVHAGVSLAEALVGMGISLGASLVLGILMDAFPTFKRSIYPILVVTQTVPMIVLAPIFIIYMGFGLAPKILTVTMMCFFPVVVGFADGMAQVDDGYVNLLRSYGASRLQVYTLAKIPAAMPALLSGLKVAATYSVSGAVVGEWIASQKGLGYYLLRVKNNYMLDKVFACVIVIILLSLMMNGLVRLLQRLFAPYMNQMKGPCGKGQGQLPSSESWDEQSPAGVRGWSPCGKAQGKLPASGPGTSSFQQEPLGGALEKTQFKQKKTKKKRSLLLRLIPECVPGFCSAISPASVYVWGSHK